MSFQRRPTDKTSLPKLSFRSAAANRIPIPPGLISSSGRLRNLKRLMHLFPGGVPAFPFLFEHQTSTSAAFPL